MKSMQEIEVISWEIRPLAGLYLLYQSKKYMYMGGGYKAARVLVSRDIAK